MIQRIWNADKKRIQYSFFFTFLLGMAAHGFAFANLNLSHDSLCEFCAADVRAWKVQLGRFMVPVVWKITGQTIVSPWLTGLLALLFVSCAVYFTVRFFDVHRFSDVFLISGIYVTNISIISCIATYTHDLTADMLAMMLASLLAFSWKMGCVCNSRYWFIVGALSTGILLGLYQSYLSNALVLIIIYSVLELLKGKESVNVFKNGMAGIGMIIGGGILYLVLTKAVCLISGVSLAQGGYNSLSTIWTKAGTVIPRIKESYFYILTSFLYPTGLKTLIKNIVHFNGSETYAILRLCFPKIVSCVPGVLGMCKFLSCISKKHMARNSRILAIVLVMILPIAMNLTYVMGGPVHDLTKCGYWLFYVFALLLVGLNRKQIDNDCSSFTEKYINGYVIASVCIFVWIVMNIQLANLSYIKKEIINQTTLSTMTRVLTRIEQLDGYVYGETPVAFIGNVSLHTPVKGTDTVNGITGMESNSSITYPGIYARYFENELQYKIQVCNSQKSDELKMNPYVKGMGVFPAKDSIQLVDGIVIVKMGADEN